MKFEISRTSITHISYWNAGSGKFLRVIEYSTYIRSSYGSRIVFSIKLSTEDGRPLDGRLDTSQLWARRRSMMYLPWRCYGEQRSWRLSWRVRCAGRIDNARVVGDAGAIGSREGGGRTRRRAVGTLRTNNICGRHSGNTERHAFVAGSPNRCWGRSSWPSLLAIRRVPVPSDGAFVEELFKSTDVYFGNNGVWPLSTPRDQCYQTTFNLQIKKKGKNENAMKYCFIKKKRMR